LRFAESGLLTTSARTPSSSGRCRKPRREKSRSSFCASVNGKTARVTLVPAGGGRYRMQINTALRKAAHADVGDVVGVELRLDRASRSLPVPSDLKVGLKRHPKARKAFEALAPGHRRHFIEWYDSAKSAEARRRRLERAIDVLLERALLRPVKR